MFKKILIANRGEIACRVMATARRLGVRTVAVYSDADADTQHVAMADEAVRIGPAAVADSYLKGDRIIQAAHQTGAEAIHPGYGFLSENPDFVSAVQAAGLTFIGPSSDAIRAMGLKDAAKALMVDAGVPVVPGYHGGNQDPDFLAAEAEKIGYPVLIKARAGGGGKGMRLVEDPGSFRAALEGAQREGAASFGDPACLIEKYITMPRHIEIQIFGDSHGNAIHLFERDCSLQRRHQKVIEEAPAPDMPPTVRDAMGQAAVNAAKAINYAGAGTVEFIVDGSGPLREDGFWFMEMNTRLQVEHPVSEAITGLDFVELQLRVAAGEPLPVAQADLSIDGWAFEARIYAEDVPKGFLPATGHLDHLSFPQAERFALFPVRVDSGVRTGDDVTPWYDPMIAKLIVHGPTRAAALAKLETALAQCHVAGCVTNLEFLGALTRHPGFARGEVDTGLIGRDLDVLIAGAAPGRDVLALAALASRSLLDPKSCTDVWDMLAGWQHWSVGQTHATLEVDNETLDVPISILGPGRFRIHIEGTEIDIETDGRDGTAVGYIADGVRKHADVLCHGGTVSVFAQGRTFSFGVPDPLNTATGESAGGDVITAPMPGLVKLVAVTSEQAVSQGEALLVLEAMKMEHTLTAPRDGTVSELLVQVGDQVTDGTILITLETEDD